MRCVDVDAFDGEVHKEGLTVSLFGMQFIARRNDWALEIMQKMPFEVCEVH